MLIMARAIPTGRKLPILPLTIATIMKSRPLIRKNVAAILYRFEFLGYSLLIVEVSIFY